MNTFHRECLVCSKYHRGQCEPMYITMMVSPDPHGYFDPANMGENDEQETFGMNAEDAAENAAREWGESDGAEAWRGNNFHYFVAVREPNSYEWSIFYAEGELTPTYHAQRQSETVPVEGMKKEREGEEDEQSERDDY